MSCMTGQAAEAVPSCESSCLPVRAHHHPAQATTNNSGPTTTTTTTTAHPSQHLEACHSCATLERFWSPEQQPCGPEKPPVVGKSLAASWLLYSWLAGAHYCYCNGSSILSFSPHPPNLPFHILPVISSRVDTNPFQKVLIFQNLICYYLP